MDELHVEALDGHLAVVDEADVALGALAGVELQRRHGRHSVGLGTRRHPAAINRQIIGNECWQRCHKSNVNELCRRHDADGEPRQGRHHVDRVEGTGQRRQDGAQFALVAQAQHRRRVADDLQQAVALGRAAQHHCPLEKKKKTK